MPRLNGILETSLYTDDMESARAFYEGVLGLQPMFSDSRLTAYAIERNVLLLFRKGTTEYPVKLKDGNIPGHGGSGELHVAFPIAKGELESWLDHLAANGAKAETAGRVAGKVSTSAIRMVTFWNSQRLGSGPCIKLLRRSRGGPHEPFSG